MISFSELSVKSSTCAVIRKFLQGAFSSDADANLSAAADEIYVLLRRLMDAAGGKSEDAKAPLKAIRNAIDTVCSTRPEGVSSTEVDALFSLYRRLQELCEERVTRATDIEGGQLVEDVLRYRLIRLVTGDTWDKSPELKLRVLKLIFDFMIRDNERLLEEGRDVPNLILTRSVSIGRGRTNLGPRRVSKWADAVAEIGRMQSFKMLPLLKLLLLENMQLSAEATTTKGAAPGTPSRVPGAVAAPGSSEKQSSAQSPSQALIDLLGVDDRAAEANVPAMSRRSSSPAPSSNEPSDDPFASLARESRPDAAFGDSEYSVPRAGIDSQFQNMSIGGPGSMMTTPIKPYNPAAFPIRVPSPASSVSSIMTGSGK